MEKPALIQLCRFYEKKCERNIKRSVIAEELRDALSVEILSTAAQLYEKSHLKRLAVRE